MIYFFKRATNDLNRVIITFSNEILKDKKDFDSQKSLLQFFSPNDLGADEIACAETIELKLVEVAVALSKGEVSTVKALIERMESDVRGMIPFSVLEFVGLAFDGKRMFNCNLLNPDKYKSLVTTVASAYHSKDLAAAEAGEKVLYEFITRSERKNTIPVLSNEKLLAMCETYLNKSKDPEAKMIAFLIQQAKA